MRIGRRHVVSAEMARDMGVDDVTRRLVDFADTLKSYDVDIYDIVAMKTLLLLSPGSLLCSGAASQCTLYLRKRCHL